MNNWLEPELERGLQPVAAPAELWNRVQGARVAKASARRLVWAMAATVVLAAVALSKLPARHETLGDPQSAAFHCQNPAQLRAWVRANTGLDVPLRASLPRSIQLIGARSVGDHAEIAYRAGNRDGVLLVSRADGVAEQPHTRLSAKASSWVMAGQRFTLACNDPADFQLACKLCHLD